MRTRGNDGEHIVPLAARSSHAVQIAHRRGFEQRRDAGLLESNWGQQNKRASSVEVRAQTPHFSLRRVSYASLYIFDIAAGHDSMLQ